MDEHRHEVAEPRGREALERLGDEAVDRLAREDPAELVDEALDAALEMHPRYGIELGRHGRSLDGSVARMGRRVVSIALRAGEREFGPCVSRPRSTTGVVGGLEERPDVHAQ